MEGLNSAQKQMYESFLRQREETIDGLGILTMAVVTAGVLEPGTPERDTFTPPDVAPETQQSLAHTSLNLIGVREPLTDDIYSEQAILGQRLS